MLLGIEKGDDYNIELLNKRLGKQLSMEGGDISSLYQDDGYLFFRLDPVETAVYNDTIDFEIRMTEGPQATYGKITVSGNTKTKDYVALREMRTIPGQKFSRSDIIRTQRELSQLGFFNPEKINLNYKLNISKFNFNNYNYNSLDISGNLNNQTLNSIINIDDIATGIRAIDMHQAISCACLNKMAARLIE